MKSKILWLLFLGGLFVPAFPDPPLHTGAYVQDVTSSSAVLAKIEPAPRALSLLLESEAGGVPRELPLSSPRRRHAFRVDGLEPGAAYRYTLRDGSGDPVDAGTFSTPPEDDRAQVRFAVVGDSGGLPWWTSLRNGPLFYAIARYDLLPGSSTNSRLGAMIAEDRPDFMLHVGDVIYPKGEHRHYRLGFFRPFAGVLRHAPCYVVVGNHDLVNDGGRQLLANFHQPDVEETGERFFSVGWGAVRVVGMDLPLHIGDGGHRALSLLDKALEGTTEPWRIVFAHYPVYSTGRHANRDDLIEHLMPRLRSHGVDVMFAGHDHNYQRFGREHGVVTVVTGGGGKSLYDVATDAGAAAARSAYHYGRVTVRGGVMRIEAVDLEGRVFDQHEIKLADRIAGREDYDPARNTRDARIRALL